ncbi:hypothetical protein OG870_31290 [Streptomyces sp. NBC_00461]|uniref:effector-associated constant component EACC1 n=1 Tax=Streptomyces sp. NBC_00461 TaxID=2975750 RepID=UPI002E1805A6
MLDELAVILSGSAVVPALVATLRAWLSAKNAHSVTLRVGDRKVLVDLEKPEEAELFLREFLDRAPDSEARRDG